MHNSPTRKKSVPLQAGTPNNDEGVSNLQAKVIPQKLYALVIGIDIYGRSLPKPATFSTMVKDARHWIAQTFGSWVSGDSVEPSEPPKSPESVESMDFNEPHSFLKRLYGAVNDANEVTKFLESLGVPADHIVNLRNGEATRDRIIHEIKALSKNPEINEGDPILIYYAGHGGLAKANERWSAKYGSKEIQVIFPFDYDQPEKPGSTTYVNCIPDKTIARLLNELASRKGDNITVIFDSCHSASANRAPEAPLERLERWSHVNHALDIPPDIDADLFESDDHQQRGAELPMCIDQTSHVYLAACGSRETAGEDKGRGFFTAALLNNMPTNRLDRITYHDLIKSIKISGQSPECYGRHKYRFLFDARITRDRSFIDVHLDTKNRLVLEAGAVAGVSSNSIWEVHQAPKKDSKHLGRFKVAELGDGATILEALDPKQPGLNLAGHRFFARCTDYSLEEDQVLKVWMSPNDTEYLFPGQVQHMGGIHESGIRYKMISARDAADVAVEIRRPQSSGGSMNADEHEAVFYWYDDTTRQYRTEELPYRKLAVRGEVEIVLFAAAKWKWHLERVNPETEQTITMKMLKVATRTSPRARRQYLAEPEDVPVEGGAANIVEEKSPIPLYGFKLKSDIHPPLHVRVFYFDTTDFSIGDMFGHRAGPGDVGTDIPSRGELLIGNGSEGGVPIRLVVSSEKQKELGYMKVFWSTQPLGLDELEQKSAFELKSGDVRGASKDSANPGEWGTACLPVIVQKGGDSSA